MMSHRTLVIIPAYNEQDTIEEVTTLSRKYADVCVVDDASKDRTPEILARLDGVHTIRHERNTHIPGAILDGMRYAEQAGYDFCITMDAGLSHDPNAIPAFTQHTDADLVLGFRRQKINVPGYRKLLSWTGNRVMNLALDRRIVPWGGPGLRDVTSGYRMYSRRAFSVLLQTPVQSRSFDFHLEALAIVYRAGLTIKETPIVYEFTNSSLRWKVVGDALKTLWRLWTCDAASPRPANA
jgi:dolichol-phosphate mannosyltransferase